MITQHAPHFAPAPRKRSIRPFLLGLLALLVVAGAVLTGLALGSTNEATPFTPAPASSVRGTFELNTTSILNVDRSGAGGSCKGQLGYADITPGTTVTLRAADGTLLGAGYLETGKWSGTTYGTGTCTFGFAFSNVDLGSDPAALFTVTVGSNGDRGEVPFTRTQLLSPGPQLTLGS